MTIKAILRTAFLALGFAAASIAAVHAQESGTIRIIAPVPPGGSLDMTARLLAEHLSAAWKQNVIVDNRPGGGTMVGARATAQSKPDGLTVLLSTSAMASYSAFSKNSGLDLHRDWTFISTVSRVPLFIAVAADAKIDSVGDLARYAKSRVGQLNYATYGATTRVMSELLNRSLGIKAEPILYTGSAQSIQALIRGDITYMLEAMSTLSPLVAANKVKILATTEQVRVAGFPQVPTLAEQGYTVSDLGVWYGLFAPAGLSPAVTERFNKEIVNFSRSARANAVLEPLGAVLTSSTPEELRDLAFRDERLFLNAVKTLGIEPQ